MNAICYSFHRPLEDFSGGQCVVDLLYIQRKTSKKKGVAGMRRRYSGAVLQYPTRHPQATHNVIDSKGLARTAGQTTALRLYSRMHINKRVLIFCDMVTAIFACVYAVNTALLRRRASTHCQQPYHRSHLHRVHNTTLHQRCTVASPERRPFTSAAVIAFANTPEVREPRYASVTLSAYSRPRARQG